MVYRGVAPPTTGATALRHEAVGVLALGGDPRLGGLAVHADQSSLSKRVQCRDEYVATLVICPELLRVVELRHDPVGEFLDGANAHDRVLADQDPARLTCC